VGERTGGLTLRTIITAQKRRGEPSVGSFSNGAGAEGGGTSLKWTKKREKGEFGLWSEEKTRRRGRNELKVWTKG